MKNRGRRYSQNFKEEAIRYVQENDVSITVAAKTQFPWSNSSLGQRTHRQNTFAYKLNIRLDLLSVQRGLVSTMLSLKASFQS